MVAKLLFIIPKVIEKVGSIWSAYSKSKRAWILSILIAWLLACGVNTDSYEEWHTCINTLPTWMEEI